MIVRDQMLDAAVALTGLDDWGEVPFLDALDVLVGALNAEAGLASDGEARAVEMITGLLVKRLRLVADRTANPGIADEQVTAPVFIVGQPRAGSTHLHALLALAEGVRAPTMWEMSAPCPPPEAATYPTDARIAAVQTELERLPEELLVRHPMSATRPEQCNLLNDWAFVNQALMASFDVPSYKDWFLDADYTSAYTAHLHTLQHLQWRHPGRWVLKYPKHLLSLDALLAQYPDAVLVWTHRDPAKVVPSAVSLTGLMRAANTPHYDPVKFGREWATIEELSLHRGLAVRDRDPHKERHIDVRYPDLMADPVGTVARVCEEAGMPFGDGSRAAVQQWIDDHPSGEHGVHRYTAAEYGLDEDRIRERFSFYSGRFL